MRMWMVNPAVLCRKHLLGEHVELHMLLGHLAKGRHVHGYVKHNCVELASLTDRHEALVKEMVKRGYQHASPLKYKPQVILHLTEFEKSARVDKELALAELTCRCADCCARANEVGTNES